MRGCPLNRHVMLALLLVASQSHVKDWPLATTTSLGSLLKSRAHTLPPPPATHAHVQPLLIITSSTCTPTATAEPTEFWKLCNSGRRDSLALRITWTSAVTGVVLSVRMSHLQAEVSWKSKYRGLSLTCFNFQNSGIRYDYATALYSVHSMHHNYSTKLQYNTTISSYGMTTGCYTNCHFCNV